MTLPQGFKDMSVKDWIWIIGAIGAVIGSWYVMGQDIQTLKSAVAAQSKVDEKQDEFAKEQRQEVITLIYRTTDEIKAELKEIRKDIRGRN